MGKFYESIPPNLIKWIEAQQMFWVASAPLGGEGHVNISPKGLKGTLHIASESQVWYEDMTGSGSETMAHLRELGNGRMTIMFCAFEGAPRIMRLFGHGRVLEFGTPEYEELLPPDVRHPGSRCAVVVDIHKVGTSCGFGVPQYAFLSHRPTLYNWCAQLEAAEREHGVANDIVDSSKPHVAEKGLKAYWIKENLKSMDGLPAMKAAHTSRTTPVHGPPRGEWGKEGKELLQSDKQDVVNGSVSAAVGLQKLKTVIDGLDGSEVTRLVIAFSLGVAITAVYIQTVGGPC
ncbi:uncharacterized protein C8Q71DRAFT_759973 [Rhodofomes roseus]|uniref:Pyridoxamine 5'-phosphate oxidase putative domain-containing protein n=1 Tax=Rhodofomes roseus TaxID=34475 RepID=A0ABQ8KGX0_9APHY|nr:uncharacterized protein C8Q71DRAFT_759973 [Rhodofomes roseus]KAH9836815.1 hypothetical protein C8Q71DRAFT_759973 [Rhodofomes roseus]